MLVSGGAAATNHDNLAEERFDTDEEIPSGADEVPIFSRGNLTSLYRRDESRAQYEQDEATRKFMLWFLRKCIAVAGRESSTIPPHDKLGMATETWGKATNLLANAIEKRRGRNGGTWLVGEYATLMELWLAVGERRSVPRPSSRRVVVDGTAHSPAPIESVAMK